MRSWKKLKDLKKKKSKFESKCSTIIMIMKQAEFEPGSGRNDQALSAWNVAPPTAADSPAVNRQ